MRLQENPYLSADQGLGALVRQIDSLYRQIVTQLNKLSEGSIYAVTNATTSEPTTGTYEQGDFVRNTAPVQLGAIGSMYIILGWVCTLQGTPGIWQECRVLTGN